MKRTVAFLAHLAALWTPPLARLRVMLAVATCTLLCLAAWQAATANPDESNANVVVSYDDWDNERLGTFEEFDGYLSYSGSALRGVGPGSNRFGFVADLPRTGWYRVFLWWPHAANSSNALSVRVANANGVVLRGLDQTQYAGQWYALGIYRLEAGKRLRLELTGPAGAPLLVDSARFQFLGEAAPALRILTSELPLAERGEGYDALLSAEGGEQPYTWQARSPLPPGLALDASAGRITGRPEKPGRYRVLFEVQDAQRASARRHLTIEVIVEHAAGQQPQLSLAPARMAQRIAPRLMLASAGPVALALEPQASAQLSDLLAVVQAQPQGSWLRVNLNQFSDVWTPAELRPLLGMSNPTPHKIIAAWSSVAWDSNRGDLWAFGGGHANYPGNDVYRWRGSTRRWERASLPSEIRQDALSNWTAVDGPDRAPASAHTYDNNIFLPILDRLLILGGAAYNNGGAFRRQATATTSRNTGPYLFDPNRADPNKVGGSHGSHVRRVAPHPEVVGGDMWQNRDLTINHPTPSVLPSTFVNGCTAYAQENGRDVIYTAGRSGSSTGQHLFRYVINDIAAPNTDSWTKVGRFWVTSSDQTACGYDPVRKLFVRIGSPASPFTYWNLNTPGTANSDVRATVSDPGGVFVPLLQAGTLKPRLCGFDFDPVRGRFLLWCGDDRVWSLTSPGAGQTTWPIARVPASSGATGLPSAGSGTGILGKWKYIPDLDVFLGLQHSSEGQVWLYKPVGWRAPTPPSSGSVLLRDGANGYAGTRETYLSRYHPTSTFGRGTYTQSNANDYSALVRFAIFRSEGGPVPEGALIQSAKLGLYKYTAYDHVYRVHRMLVPWEEYQATWLQRASGVAWGAPGARASGSDYAAAVDGQSTVTWDPQWLEIDVTAAIQRFSDGQPNYGWKLVTVSGDFHLKRFYTREATTAVALRPRLAISYVGR